MSTDPTGPRGPSASAASPVAEQSPRAGASTAEPPVAGPSMKGRRQQARPQEQPAAGRAASGKAPPRRKRKVRKVHRVVRHLEVWSIAKMAAAFAVCGYLVCMISGYLLWQAAERVGTVDGIEGFMEDAGSYDSYEIVGGVVFRVAAASGIVLAMAAVAIVVLAAVLFNLISDITGGIRMTVIDEDLIVAPARRPEADPARRPEADPARRPPASNGRDGATAAGEDTTE